MPRSGVTPSKTVLAGGVLVLAALAAYHGSFSGPFLFDDVPSIPGNATIRQLWPLWPALSPPTGGLTVSGRPVLNLSFAISHEFSGNSVWGYHSTNLLIHVLAGARAVWNHEKDAARASSVLEVPLRGTKEDGPLRKKPLPLAFAVALIWTVHPLQTESVTYVVQRAESLMGLFYLLTIYCFVRFAGSSFVPRSGTSADEKAGLGFWGWLSIGACLLGMATKEVMVSAPVIVFLYDRTFISGSFREAWRRRRGFYAGLACTWLVLGWTVVSGGARGGSAGFGTGIPWSLYLQTQFFAIVHYLRLSVWPHPLVFDYGMELARSPWTVFSCFAIVMLLIAGTLWCSARRSIGGRAAGFAGIFFFAILAPTSLVPVATEVVAEHRMYLALAPVLALVVCHAALWGGRALRSSALRSAGGWGALLVVTIVCVYLTARRNDVYASEVTLWQDTLAKYPNNPRAHYDLGVALLHGGNSPDAKAQFEEAVRLAPDYAEALMNLGNVLEGEGRYGEAIADYEKALGFRPRSEEAHYNLGIALAQTGDIPGAIAQYGEALRLKPDYLEAHANLGAALVNSGRIPEGIAELEEAERLDPGSAQIHYNLGLVLRAVGREDEARVQLEAAANLQPKSDDAGR